MLPWAQYVHNTSVHSVTGCTPLYLEMGNPKETMVEVAHLPELMSEQDVKEVALERVRFYYELSRAARTKDLKYHNEAIKRQQDTMDKLAKADALKVGMLVLVHLPWVSKGLNSKLADRWHGPFKIMSVLPNSYLLQDANENSETSQLLKVAKGRVRRYRSLQGDLEAPEGLVKRTDGVKDWVESGLFPWKAVLELEPGILDDESRVWVAPHQVTALMLDLTKPTEGETDEQRSDRILSQCHLLSARYYPHGNHAHASVSTAYWTGDYGQLVAYIQDHPNVVTELVNSLDSPNVVTLSSNADRDGGTGSGCELSMEPSSAMEADIKDHYVLLLHEGQVRGRNLNSTDQDNK